MSLALACVLVALGQSCTDRANECATWAALGKCSKDRSHMSNECPYSCKTSCGGKGAALVAAIALEPVPKADQYRQLGDIYAIEGKMVASEQSLRLATEIAPTDSELQRLLGTVVKRLGDAEGALTLFRKAAQLNHSNAWAHVNIGNALTPGDECFAAYREAIRVDPTMTNAYLSLGDKLLAGGRAEEGVATLRSLAAFSAQHDPGRLYEKLSEHQRVVEAAYAQTLADTRRGPQTSAVARNWMEYTREALGDDKCRHPRTRKECDEKCLTPACIEGLDQALQHVTTHVRVDEAPHGEEYMYVPPL